MSLKKNRLSDSALEVTDFCLGTMTWGQQNTEAEGHAQIDWALANGINLIDTAEMYPVPPQKETQGRTESIVGAWLGKNRGKRDKIVLASKIAGPGRREWIRNGETHVTKKTIPWAAATLPLHGPSPSNVHVPRTWNSSPVPTTLATPSSLMT